MHAVAGGVCQEEVSAEGGGGCLPGGVSAQRGCLCLGGFCLGGCLPGGCTPPPVDRQTPVKHKLSATAVADGN